MPLADEDFPYEVQVAFLFYSLLSDRWDGMNGVYLGKDWNALDTLFNVYEIEKDRSVILHFMKMNELYHIDAAGVARQAREKRAARKNG